MNAVILTPAFSHTHPALERAILRSGIPWLPIYGHSDLPRVRSVLIEQGLARGAERLLLVDADVVPTIDVLRALVETPNVTPTRAIWGLYPLREGDRWSVSPADPEDASRALDAGRHFKIRTGGLGLCAIHRESLERAGAKLPTIAEDTGARWRPFCVPIIRDATYYADDGSLCVRLRETGTELWCDPALRAAHVVTRAIKDLDNGKR